MFAALLSASLLAPAAPVPKDFTPTGPAPYSIDIGVKPDGAVIVVTYPAEKAAVPDGGRPAAWPVEIPIRVVPLDELADLRITTADGTAVTVREAAKLMAAGTSAVASTDGKPVGAVHRRNLTPGTLVLVSLDLVSRKVEGVSPAVWPRDR
jgi:hypothetical protein